jgi:hypothetical protein
MIVIMDRETFDQLMLKEWQQDVLKMHQPHCDTPYFNILWDLRDKLYDFFYPLGIQKEGIHDVARVADAFAYSESADGRLSIVVAQTLPKEMTDRFAKFARKYKPDYEPKPVTPHLNIFVMFGDPRELDPERVRAEALRHGSTWEFVGYEARPFNIETLKGLHSFVHRFEEERRLARSTVPSDACKYFKYSEETKEIIQQMILEQKR